MRPERPRLPTSPCPVCGNPVDPLRAPRVLWLDDGARFLCGGACSARFVLGERGYDTPSRRPRVAARAERPSIPDLVREATRPGDADSTARDARPRPAYLHPFVPAALALLGLVILAISPSREIGWLAAFLFVLGAAVHAREPRPTIRAELLVLAIAPLGLVLGVLGAITTEDAQAQRWALLGVGAAALAVSVRHAAHAMASQPMRSLTRELLDTLPSIARIPRDDSSSYEEVRADAVRQGDVVVVLEGERAPADGVVEEGAGIGLVYPRAVHSRPYGEGDFLLGGTRVLEGAITVRVVRAGADRAVVRAVELADRQHRNRTLAARARRVLGRWGGVALLPAAGVALALGGPTTASVVLLGVPLLGTLAAFDAALDAAALASARRGIFFGSAGALHRAGRTATVAILFRGALTAGEPAVQSVRAVGTRPVQRVLALAAAAEQAAEEHPIARAIRRHAEEEAVPRAMVRKERLLGGLGVTAVSSHGVPVVVGRRQLLLDEGISVALADEEATRLESEGRTPIFVAIDGTLEALIAILDMTHVGAPDAVRRIAELPAEVVILSGDDRRTVERIASSLGPARVKAPLLPHERVAEVRALRETQGLTAAVGRGGEDDAVLAEADLPISLRLVGTALEDRGVAVSSRDVRDAADALWIARAARRATWRTLAALVVVAALVGIGAALGWLKPIAAAWLALAADTWSLRTGSRLLRRVDLRVPTRQ